MITQLIMTRVSHDLAGIIGAIHNTTELLEIDPSFSTEAGPVIKNSTTTLSARLKLFRALFGTNTKTIEPHLITDYVKTLSASFELIGHPTTREQASAILICCDLMIYGGTITIQERQVIGNGTIKTENALTDIMVGKLDETTPPKWAPAAWLMHLTTQSGNPATFSQQDNQIIFSW